MTLRRERRPWPVWTIEVDFSAVDQQDAEVIFERVLDLLGVRHLGGTLTLQPEETDA